MPEILKEYPTATAILIIFALVGHFPIKAALKPAPDSKLAIFLRIWEAVSLDILKIIKTRAKDSAALKIIELIQSAESKDAPQDADNKTMLPPPPDSTTKPITIEPPAPMPPKEGQS